MAVFKKLVKEIMGFVSIGSVTGFENSRHYEHQSHVKLKSCAKLLLL